MAWVQRIRKRIRAMQAYVALLCGSNTPRQASMRQQRLCAGERNTSGTLLLRSALLSRTNRDETAYTVGSSVSTPALCRLFLPKMSQKASGCSLHPASIRITTVRCSFNTAYHVPCWSDKHPWHCSRRLDCHSDRAQCVTISPAPATSKP